MAKERDVPTLNIQGFDCTYYSDVQALAGFGAANKSSVGALVVRGPTKRHQSTAISFF
jgi:hypothetical protein